MDYRRVVLVVPVLAFALRNKGINLTKSSGGNQHIPVSSRSLWTPTDMAGRRRSDLFRAPADMSARSFAAAGVERSTRRVSVGRRIACQRLPPRLGCALSDRAVRLSIL